MAESEIKSDTTVQHCLNCRRSDCFDRVENYCSRCLLFSHQTETQQPSVRQRLRNGIKWLFIAAGLTLIFIIILADAVLGMATILYGITDKPAWIFLPWLALVFMSYQFFLIAERHRASKRVMESPRWQALKVSAAAFIGILLGVMIWPAFDQYNGSQIGIAFGSLLGIAIELIIEIIILTRPL